jgi:aryl-alcohol dehydrogenase-like predicted oxidoreductase
LSGYVTDQRQIALDARQSGTFTIKDLGEVHRLGFGAMRITGPGIWGEPADREVTRQVVRRAVELGTDFIDTADAYGPNVSEEIIAEALHSDGRAAGSTPYGEVKIATKIGNTRQGPDQWAQVGRPAYLRQAMELILRRLKVDKIDLLQLHRIDAEVPAEQQFETLAAFQAEGKVGALGLSEVSVAEIERASEFFTVATVQNRYNLTDRKSEDVLDYSTEHGIGFIPWAPISAGQLAAPGGPVAEAAERLGATPSQVALAWLLRRSPAMLPIPGTSTVAHLEENIGAASVQLDDESYESIANAVA